MGFVQVIAALVVLATVAFPTLAKDIYVGDDYGWKLDFDYQYWANGKDFYVGDRLIFVYNKEMHNVLKVKDGYDFQRCVKQFGVAPFTGGYNVIQLTRPGKKWYVCGVTDHCNRGMKVAINVKPKKEEQYKYKRPPYQQNGYPSAPYSNKKTYNNARYHH